MAIGNAQWIDASHRAVWWADPDGSYHSRAVTDPELAAWLADGNIPTPEPPPSPHALFASALDQGVAIQSTGTPALDAGYEARGPRWDLMKDEAQYIATFGGFSGGVSTLEWSAASGTVTFDTTAHFLAVVRAIGDWLTGWHRYIAGQAGSAPASPVTIA